MRTIVIISIRNINVGILFVYLFIHVLKVPVNMLLCFSSDNINKIFSRSRKNNWNVETSRLLPINV